MADIQITTTQNVNLKFKLADLNLRIFAWLIDSLIKYSYLGVIAYVFFGLLKLDDFFRRSSIVDQWSIMAIGVVLLLPFIFYTLVLESFLGGQTVGKKLLKIKVLKIDGYQTSFIDFFIRWVMRIVDINSMSGILALIFIGSSKKQQRLGGMASGTAVVSLRNKINISHTILEEGIQEDYEPKYSNVVKLTDNDVRIIKENFIKAKAKKDHALYLKLRDKIEEVIGQKNEEETIEQFLDIVIKDYNFYTKNM